MYMTIEERERFAYITNSPVHPLILLALEGDEDARAEVADLERQVSERDAEVSRLEGALEDKDKDTEVATLEEKLGHADDTINELRAKLDAAVPSPKRRSKPRKAAGVTDLL